MAHQNVIDEKNNYISDLDNWNCNNNLDNHRMNNTVKVYNGIICIAAAIILCIAFCGCVFPKKYDDGISSPGVREPIGAYHNGGSDTPIHRSKYLNIVGDDKTVDTICSHDNITVISTFPPMYNCMSCNKTMSTNEYWDNKKLIKQSKCDHFFVMEIPQTMEAMKERRLYCVKCELVIKTNQ